MSMGLFGPTGFSALTRRGSAMARAGVAALLVSVAAAAHAPADAQAFDWLKGVAGFGTEGEKHDGRRDARARREADQQPQRDLRSDPMPMRSEQMLGALQKAIDRYSQIAQKGGWPLIPGARAMRPGDDDERIPLVRKRLVATGEMRPAQGYETFSYDGELEAAVRRFQERHGLRVSGRIDKPTLQAMNVPAQARVAQLQRNYQRIEELLGQRIEDRYILVNVPSFQLEAVERGVVEQRHRVIAGKPERQTPVVKAQVRALNFFPFWRVPDSVATLDLIPRLRKEPDYLQKEQIRVLSGAFNGPELDSTTIDWTQADSTRIKFRQDPGPQNALGLVRLDMPNEHGVYMHDTPMKPLFGQAARAFSAGCVRVQDVFDLAAWIARDEPGMDRQKVDEILSAGMATDITLQRPVPVYFAYVTAWAESDGRVEFRPDIYGRDGLRELSGDRERDPDAPPPPPSANTLAP
jgi:murein L,D-transpeptidase YcbB/YkuD